MTERAPRREVTGNDDLLYLAHPGASETFSGYGLPVYPDNPSYLVGMLMVDRPQPVDAHWLARVGAVYGSYELAAMTAGGERGIVCQMQIEPGHLRHLQRIHSPITAAIQQTLTPLRGTLPHPVFNLRWDDRHGAWRSRLAPPHDLPEGLAEVFRRTGHGSAAFETAVGVVHACHAADSDIAGFVHAPLRTRWQLVTMPTAPLIRFEAAVLDQPHHPYRFESFLNPGADDQLSILAHLAGQDKLYIAFYGDDLRHRYTRLIPHGAQQWQQLDDLVEAALDYLQTIPPERRDFDQAKETYLRTVPY